MDAFIGTGDVAESGISKHVLDRPYAAMQLSHRNGPRSKGKVGTVRGRVRAAGGRGVNWHNRRKSSVQLACVVYICI